MKKTAIVLCVLFLFIGGCEAMNRDNLNNLEVGMTKTEVLGIMGKPYKREVYDNTEWLMYETEVYVRVSHINEIFTPLCIKNGKLVGWGRNYYQNETKKYDVKINTNQ